MPEEGVHVGAVVAAPQLEGAVKGAAVQLVRALPEGQARDGVPVAWQALRSKASSQLPILRALFAASCVIESMNCLRAQPNVHTWWHAAAQRPAVICFGFLAACP